MRITKLKIFGFKSFAQRTEVSFPGNGLTAVVGPNGAGKSNIVDAIRWVLGEQHASVLRMDKMQSVIFSGTEERAAMSMAEVSLLIDNNTGDLPSEYTEVMVTRRAHRNGTNEYLINNQECRLKDIQNLFFDSGLGSGNYSQMNEAMIRNVLADNPEYRRKIFEEAAGVSKYKQQRKETVRQLETVRINMERVEDNLRHEQASVRQYEKQAEKTTEWKRLRARLKELDLSMSLDRHEENRKNMMVLSDAKIRVVHEQEANQTRLAELEAKIEEKKLAISGDEENLRNFENAVKAEELALNDLNNEISRYRDSQANIDATIQKYELEIATSEEQINSLHSEKDRLEEETKALGAGEALSEKERQLAIEEEALMVLRDTVDELREESRTLSEKRIAALNKANSLRSRWQRLDGETEMLRQDIEKRNAEKAEQELRKHSSEDALAAIDSGKEEAVKDKENFSERKIVQEEEIETLKASLADEEKKLSAAESKRASLVSRIEVLQGMDSEADAGADWVITNKASDVEGLLGTMLNADSKYATEIEFALGRALNAVVTKNPAHLDELLRSLDMAQAGSAVFVTEVDSTETSEDFPVRPGVIGIASKFVNAPAFLQTFISRLLSKYILVESFATAKALALEFSTKDYWFLSLDGRAVSTSGIVCGGRGKGESLGILGRRAEVEKDKNELNAVALEIEKLKNSKDRLADRLEETQMMLAETNDSIREAEEKIRSGSAAEKIHKDVLANIERQVVRIESDIRNAEDRIRKAEGERASDTELAQAEASAKNLEEEYSKVMDRLSEEDLLFKEKDESVKELRTKLGSDQNTLRANLSRIESIGQQVKLHLDIIAGRKKDISSLDIQKEELKNKEQGVSDRVQAKDALLRQKETERDAARERYNVVAGDVEEWRSEVKAINTQLLERASNLNDITLRIGALGSNIDRMRERIASEWEVDIDHPDNVVRVEYEEKEAHKEINDLRAKIKALGPVNVDIMDNFEAEKARLADVEKQFNDLDLARASLERTISKLDGIARDRFLETFRHIQKNFQDVFSRVMINGETKLALQEGVDPLEAAIEVNARPTGKKMRGVTALSGGERALTAVSLLFAIYMEKPSPYCVLDEVDGPLDDANIGRFMELLRHFSNQTQFILVTHNKRTMAAADMLYGVTQEIKGISRIASVKLDDAVALELHANI
ncbi:MAG: chromosome segregation protein SMC [Fibrobacteraceae bacterium]|nr:chromosome segregation protein SMC [Fibrobacteraceae bacterium]